MATDEPSENPFLEGYESPWYRRGTPYRRNESHQPPPTGSGGGPRDSGDGGSSRRSPLRRRGPSRLRTMIVVLSLALTAIVSAATLYIYERQARETEKQTRIMGRQTELMDRQTTIMEQQREDNYRANQPAIDHANGQKKLEEAEKLRQEGEALQERSRRLLQRQPAAPSRPMPALKNALAKKPSGDFIARNEFDGQNAKVEQKFSVVKETLDDLRRSLPRGAKVEELRVSRYRITLSGPWSDEAVRELKRNWATACQIDVERIVRTPNGLQFYSPGCEPGTFDDVVESEDKTGR